MGLQDNIAVIKKSDTEYTALLMQCTHQENPVQFTGEGFYCPSHGSKFDMDGNVTVKPARTPLKHYNTKVENGNVIISL
jgi:cytochrome b6-f complex iron-sulfur subunit